MDRSSSNLRGRMISAAARIVSESGFGPDLVAVTCAVVGVPETQARKQFQRDEDLLLALFARVCYELELRVEEVNSESIGERFRQFMELKFEIAEPFHDALAASIATTLDPRNELYVLGSPMQLIRSRMKGLLSSVTRDAKDGEQFNSAQGLHSLYLLHLALMLMWSQDRSPGRSSTRFFLESLSLGLPFLSMLLKSEEFQEKRAKIESALAGFGHDAIREEHNELSREILSIFFQHRRLISNTMPCAIRPCRDCFAPHLPRLNFFLETNQPIHFLLPGFPAKSPSPRKTLGRLPDRAEEIGLQQLQMMCSDVSKIYSPGCRITICSDGHVFGDLVGVDDETITSYGSSLRDIIRQSGYHDLDTFELADLICFDNYEQARADLISEYALDAEIFKQRAASQPSVRHLVDGIHRFLFEEQVDLDESLSRTQVRNRCRETAYEVVRRSDAWGRLLLDCFPAALRLSIHPQHPHSEKIGVLLGNSDDAWLTPWHSAALETIDGWSLTKVQDGMAKGARIVSRDGSPYYLSTVPD